MAKEFLTTFEAAKILSVTPDAVLKWIKSGILKARRTPGGHHRIAKKSIEDLVERSQKISRSEKFQYCWEFNANNDNCLGKCEECVVFKASAKRCYRMYDFPDEFGHLKLFCDSTCEECNYYKSYHSIN